MLIEQLSRLNGFTHVLYQWRAYTTIYMIHVPVSCKSWLKARYWPSCIHLANKEGAEARQPFPVSDIHLMAALCDEALYTENTAVLVIGPYLVSERKPFPNHFSFSVH